MILDKRARILFLAIFICAFIATDGLAIQKNVRVKLLFPKKSGSFTRMKAPEPILKPVMVSGTVIIDVTPRPSRPVKGRYLVEYFFDDQPVYKTDGYNKNGPKGKAFGFALDTTRYENGRHKVVVNFWDERTTSSAIGIINLVIAN